MSELNTYLKGFRLSSLQRNTSDVLLSGILTKESRLKNSKKKTLKKPRRESKLKFQIGDLVRCQEGEYQNQIFTIHATVTTNDEICYKVYIDTNDFVWVPEEELELATDFQKDDHVYITKGAHQGQVAIIDEILGQIISLTDENGILRHSYKKTSLKLVDSGTPVAFWDEDNDSIDENVETKDKFQIGDLVRITKEAFIRRFFEKDQSTSRIYSVIKLNRPSNEPVVYQLQINPPKSSVNTFSDTAWFTGAELELAEDFRKDDRVFITQGLHKDQIAIIINCDSDDNISLGDYAKTFDVNYFKKSDLKLVDSLTPVTFNFASLPEKNFPDINISDGYERNYRLSQSPAPKYQVGDLVRIKSDCSLNSSLNQDHELLNNSKGKVFKINHINSDGLIDIELDSGYEWIFEFSPDEIEPATEIKVGDRVIVTEGTYKNSVTQILSLNNGLGVTAKIHGIVYYNFYPSFLQLVDSKTPLVDCFDGKIKENFPSEKKIESSTSVGDSFSKNYQIGDLVRVTDNESHYKGMVFKIKEKLHSGYLFIGNMYFGPNQIELITKILVGDRILILEGNFKNTITRVIPSHNLAYLEVKVKRDVESTAWLKSSEVKIVESQTPLIYYYLGDIIISDVHPDRVHPDINLQNTLIPATAGVGGFYDYLNPPCKKQDLAPDPILGEVTHLRSSQDKLHLEINRLTSELALATSDNRNITIKSFAKDNVISDLRGQLTLTEAHVERLKKALPTLKVTLRDKISNAIGKCLDLATNLILLVCAISCYLLWMGASLITFLGNKIEQSFQWTTKFVSQKTTTFVSGVRFWRQEINHEMWQGHILVLVITTMVIFPLVTLAELDTLWFREERRADLIPAPGHIPSPNDPQEQAKIQNRLLQEQLKEFKQKLKGMKDTIESPEGGQ